MAISKETKKQLAHFLAGAIILIKAFDKAEHGHVLTGGILGFIGVAIVVMNFFHHRLAHRVRSFDALVFLAEAVVLGLVSGLYFHDGKKALPFAYALASGGYLVTAFRFFRRSKSGNHLEISNDLLS
ncbi:hypothetical protein ACFPMF_24030 [Larkinella bovis]|uniref:Uncharacterized protein n=1 Tax=Larkinella bovis TaxID=683041 RepID=A0ABW0IIM1_9BACT